MLEKCGVQPDAIVEECRRLIKNLPKAATAAPQPGLYVSQPLNAVLEKAFDEALRFKDEFVSTEHLLLAHLRADATIPPASCSTAPAPLTTPS